MGELLQQRALAEAEVLRIFTDVCAAVAQLHVQEPPIAHRDLKARCVLVLFFFPSSLSYTCPCSCSFVRLFVCYVCLQANALLRCRWRTF